MEQSQQLDALFPKTHLWLDLDDDESDEEEVGVGFLARHANSINGVGTLPTSNGTSGQLKPDLALASSDHSDHEKETARVGDSRRSEEIMANDIEDTQVVKGEGLQGTKPINGHSEIQKNLSMNPNHQEVKNVEDHNFSSLNSAPLGQLYKETYTSFKHLEDATKADVIIDINEEIEEDLMEIDVQRVLDKQNTHDLYCPNCNSCITRKVILRRKPKISNTHHKQRRIKKSDQIPLPVNHDYTGVSAPGELTDDTKQEQEAFSCLSCFSFFIPLGNGCFKIFQFLRYGRQNENTQTAQEISQKENTPGSQEKNQRKKTPGSAEIQSPQEISHKEKTKSPRGINQNEKTETLQKLSHNEDTEISSKISNNEDTQSPQNKSSDENTHSPQHISHNGVAQSLLHISHNEDIQCPRNTSCKESTQSPRNINQTKSKQSSQKIPTASTNSIFSVFTFSKDKTTLKKEDNGIEDVETGLLEPTFSTCTEVASLSQSRVQNERRGADASEEWEILKSIVYGGLIESIISLGVVSSATGAGANTLNVLALGLANSIGGLFIIGHNLRELKNDCPHGASTERNLEEDRYQILLGHRQNSVWHVTVAILSFLIFGLVPPVVYGFSFLKSDDRDLKLAAVVGASLVCIIFLALGKGHVRKPHRTYFRTVIYYVILGIAVSGSSYIAGKLLKKLLNNLGLFVSSSAVSVPFLETMPLDVGRASY